MEIALKYAPEEIKTYDLCLIAVRQNEKVLKYVLEEIKTYDLCLIAVRQNGVTSICTEKI